MLENGHQQIMDYKLVWKMPLFTFFVSGTGKERGVAAMKDNTNDDGNNTSKDLHIKKMEITYMKSYSEKWENSFMKVYIRSNDTDVIDPITGIAPVLASANYSGLHEERTSEYYTETLLINGTHVGENL